MFPDSDGLVVLNLPEPGARDNWGRVWNVATGSARGPSVGDPKRPFGKVRMASRKGRKAEVPEGRTPIAQRVSAGLRCERDKSRRDGRHPRGPSLWRVLRIEKRGLLVLLGKVAVGCFGDPRCS